MASAEDGVVLRLLSHLAWLNRADDQQSTGPTLEWARRVYNSSVHLQFRFVYPHSDKDRVAKKDQQPLAAAIEAVVSTAAEAVDVIRDTSGAFEGNSQLDNETSSRLQRELGNLLAKANAIQWSGMHTPKEDVRLDQSVNPIRLLSEWRQRHARRRKKQTGAVNEVRPSDEANPKADFLLGLVTKIVADGSPVIEMMPEAAADIFQQVADAQFSADLEEFRRSQGDPATLKIAEEMLQRRS